MDSKSIFRLALRIVLIVLISAYRVDALKRSRRRMQGKASSVVFALFLLSGLPLDASFWGGVEVVEVIPIGEDGRLLWNETRALTSLFRSRKRLNAPSRFL